MKQIFLNIPDSKFQIFLEFIKTLDYVEVGKSIEELEDLEDVRLYDEAMKEDDGTRIPMDEVFKRIEAKRKNKI